MEIFKALECQDCGKVIRVLTEYENQQVSHDPYKYLGYCEECYKARYQGAWPNENE